LSEELKRLKSDMVEKDDSIEELQKRVARLNAVSSVKNSLIGFIMLV